MSIPDATSDTVQFKQVFASEYKDILVRDPSLPKGSGGGEQPSVDNDLIGLALSGGGIRSAAFALGGLQALNQYKVLKQIHYLSTVSGGGYIGTAMTVGMSTNGAFPFGKTGEDEGETPATRHLRDHSRYLVERGVSSVMSALAIYLRGIVTNILIVFPLLLAAAAVFVWWLPDSNILKTGHGWIYPFSELSDGFKKQPMPLSLLGVAIMTFILMIYAVLVSVVGVKRQRGKLAAAVSVLFWVLGAIVLYELHCWLLSYFFARQTAGTEGGGYVVTNLYSLTQAMIAVVLASLGGIFPFIKQIAKLAVSDKQAGVSDTMKRWISRVLLIVAAAIVPLLLWLLLMQLIFWGIAQCTPADAQTCTATWRHAPEWFQWLTGPAAWSHLPEWLQWLIGGKGISSFIQPHALYFAVALVLFCIACLLSVNSNSLHQLYRDRLGIAFLAVDNAGTMEPADTFNLHNIKPENCPYHLINAALNVPGSRFANARGRNADFFVFSKNYTGSEMTGYVDTKTIEETVSGLNIGTAMAISGAAAAPNMGMASMRPLSPTIAFLNVRLGRWLKHPQGIGKLSRKSGYVRWWLRTPGLTYLFREAFSKSGNDLNPDGFCFLTDGGHIENLGVYELLRRRCKIIIAIDGEADPDLDGGSLVQLERFARIDLGTTITMDWKGIGERTRKVSEEIKKKEYNPQKGPHVALGSISYPALTAGGPREAGLLVYVKASLSGDENDYVLNYKATHASFPHETTLDQLFTEEQFECYRALGEHIMRHFLAGQDHASPRTANRATLVQMFNNTIKGVVIA